MIFNRTIVVTSALIFDNRKRVLLLKRSKFNKSHRHEWQLPEGKVEFNETIEQTLVREVLEETNLKIDSFQIVFSNSHIIKLYGITLHILRLICLVKQWSGQITLSKDHDEFYWYSVNSKKITLGQNLKLILNKVL